MSDADAQENIGKTKLQCPQVRRRQGTGERCHARPVPGADLVWCRKEECVQYSCRRAASLSLTYLHGDLSKSHRFGAVADQLQTKMRRSSRS
jgi:hypothetical protein